MGAYRPLAERFWEKVDVGDADECWEWTGARSGFGYGVIRAPRSRKMLGAHRVSALLAGMAVDDEFVLHSCDNPACVNPGHLRTGSQFDNMRDCAARGRVRGGASSGHRHHRAKVSTREASTMRAVHALGGVTMGALADTFGCSRATVSRVIGRHGRWAVRNRKGED